MGHVGEQPLTNGGCKLDRPPPSIGFKLSLWMVRWMYRVDVYLRVRRTVMVEGMSIRDVIGGVKVVQVGG